MKEDVLPFAGSMALLAAGWCLSWWLDRSTAKVAGPAGTKFPETTPSELGRYVALWMDRAQAVSLLVPPAVGLLLGGGHVWWVHGVALLFAFGCVANVAYRRDPTSYGARQQGRSRMSVALYLSAGVNIAGLGAALLTE